MSNDRELEEQIGAHPIDEQIVDYLRRRYDDGGRYVSSRYISREVRAPRSYIGRRLIVLEDEGLLERWSDGEPATYRLTEQCDDEVTR